MICSIQFILFLILKLVLLLLVDELLLQKQIKQLLNTTHSHMTHKYREINLLDMHQKINQFDDLKKLFHITNPNILFQKDEQLFRW